MREEEETRVGSGATREPIFAPADVHRPHHVYIPYTYILCIRYIYKPKNPREFTTHVKSRKRLRTCLYNIYIIGVNFQTRRPMFLIFLFGYCPVLRSNDLSFPDRCTVSRASYSYTHIISRCHFSAREAINSYGAKKKK